MNNEKNTQTINANANVDQRKFPQKAIKSIKEEMNNSIKIRIISSKDDLHQKGAKILPNTNHHQKIKKYLTSVNDNLYQKKKITLNYNDNKSESNMKTKNNIKNYGSANFISNKKKPVSSKENKTLKKFKTINNNNNNNIKEHLEQKCNKKIYKNSFIKPKNYTSMQYANSPKISRMSNFFLNSVTHNDLNNCNININPNNLNISNNNKHNTLANHKNKNLGNSNPNFNSINEYNNNVCLSIINDKNYFTKQKSSREKQKLSTSNNNRNLNQTNSKSKHKKNVKSKIKKSNDNNNSVNNYSLKNKAKLSYNSNNSFKNYINNSALVNNGNSNHLKSNNEENIYLGKNKNICYDKIKEKIWNNIELELELENNINQINYTIGNLSSNDFALCNTNSNLETIYEKLMKLCNEKGLTLTKIDTNKYICKKDGDNSIKIEINTKGRTNVLKLYYLNGKEVITKEIIRQIVLRIGF